MPRDSGPAAVRPAGPLTRLDWLEAGQRLLLQSGVKGLKLRPLAASLGISTGSFYHHFADFDAFLANLARYYSGEQLAANVARVRHEAASPLERIIRASELAGEVALPQLIGAMREWARNDPRAAAEVTTLERTLMAFLAECFTELGFTPAEAATRAFVLMASASAEVAPPEMPGGKPALGRHIVELVCRGAPKLG